ncbi:MAG: hypothetical protein WC282_04900, partial [Bacilli bacterium]
LSLLNSGSIPRISSYLAESLGVGNRLFYSPLFHLFSSLIYFVTHGMGGNAVDAIKTVMFISVFISGIFMYRFILKVTDGNIIAATLAAALYIVYPYRIFDALCRAAYAEALSFAFIPLFFKGLHGLVNFKKSIGVLPFLEVIIGGALLFLSHNLTAMFGFIFGVIFLLTNTSKIAKLGTAHRRYFPSCIAALVILVGLMSINLFSALELMGTGLYNISDDVRMWTTLSHVINRINTSFSFSGFINLPYMNSAYGSVMNYSIALTQIISFLLLSVLFIVVDNLLKRIKALRYFHFLISAVIYLGLVFALAYRLEVIFGAVITIVIYFAVTYMLKVKNDEAQGVVIYKEIDFWFLIGILILTFILITQKWIWRIMPEALLKIQFPWRLWAYIQFFLSWLLGLLVAKVKYKKVVPYASAIAVGFCLVTNQGLPEKRLLRDSIEEPSTSSLIFRGDDDFLRSIATIGWNKEYIPQVFTQNDYVSEYPNSLYGNIRLALLSSYTEAYPYNPAVLSGDCSIEVLSHDTPDYELAITANAASLIQMPLIYYPGYSVKVTAGAEQNTIDAFNIDGLVAFHIESGAQYVSITYVGTPLMIASYVYAALAVVGIGGMVLFYLLAPDRKNDLPLDGEKIS